MAYQQAIEKINAQIAQLVHMNGHLIDLIVENGGRLASCEEKADRQHENFAERFTSLASELDIQGENLNRIERNTERAQYKVVSRRSRYRLLLFTAFAAFIAFLLAVHIFLS